MEVLERNSAWPRYNQCSRKGVIEREGRWYCKQHDPVAVEKRREKEQDKFDAKMKVRMEEQRRAAAIKKACDGVSTEELETLSVKELLKLEEVQDDLD